MYSIEVLCGCSCVSLVLVVTICTRLINESCAFSGLRRNANKISRLGLENDCLS